MSESWTPHGAQAGSAGAPSLNPVPDLSVWGREAVRWALWDQLPLSWASPHPDGNQRGGGAAEHTHSPPRAQVKVIEFPTPVRNRITPDSRVINSVLGLELYNTVHFWAKSLKPKGLFLRTSSLLFSAFLIRNSAIQPDLHGKHNLSSHTDGCRRVGRRFAFHFSSANISWAPECARPRAKRRGRVGEEGGLPVPETLTVEVGDRPPSPVWPQTARVWKPGSATNTGEITSPASG